MGSKMLNKTYNNFLNFCQMAIFSLAVLFNSPICASELPENNGFVQSSKKWIQDHHGLVVASGIAVTAAALYYFSPSVPVSPTPVNFTSFPDQEPYDCFFSLKSDRAFFQPYKYEGVTSSAQGFIAKISGWLSEVDNPLFPRYSPWNRYNIVRCWVKNTTDLLYCPFSGERDYCWFSNTKLAQLSCEIGEGDWIMTNSPEVSYVKEIYAKLLSLPDHLNDLKQIYAHEVSKHEQGYNTFYRRHDLLNLCPELCDSACHAGYKLYDRVWHGFGFCASRVITY